MKIEGLNGVQWKLQDKREDLVNWKIETANISFLFFPRCICFILLPILESAIRSDIKTCIFDKMASQ